MRIYELTTGQEITLQVRIGDQTLTFTSIVLTADPHKSAITAKAIFSNNKPVSMRGTGVLVDLIVNLPNEKPIQFKNVIINLFKSTIKGYFYQISTVAESTTLNRRENFRLFVGNTIPVQFGANTSPRNAILRDVSATGFAVVCDRDVRIDPHKIIHAVLNDQPRENGPVYSFQLFGLVARTQELENGKLLIGCRLNAPVPGLDKYITEKERIQIQNKGKL